MPATGQAQKLPGHKQVALNATAHSGTVPARYGLQHIVMGIVEHPQRIGMLKQLIGQRPHLESDGFYLRQQHGRTGCAVQDEVKFFIRRQIGPGVGGFQRRIHLRGQHSQGCGIRRD